ncbi:MAG: hypothetical protein NDI69_05065 [Bacteriovoracaceae bacterium]|nr:hypothetical protein [Bacteriovoracaceae bacterium]
MTSSRYLWSLTFFASFLLSLSAMAQSFQNKILKINGTSSEYGVYQGELELRSKNNKIQATKVFTYQDYKFENLSVQEVWTGEATQVQDQLVINFSIRQAVLFKSAEGMSRSPEMFHANLKVTQIIELNSMISFFRGQEAFNENITGVADLKAKPLWENLRTQTESYGKESSLIIKLLAGFIDMKVFNWYHADSMVRAYEHREEFKSKNHYFVFDPTDHDFYQQNPNILRVVNKVPDTISLIEDIQRRNAYAPTLEEKMEHYEDQMIKYHINDLGQFSTAQFDKNGHFVRYVMVGDGALWTGMYLASQAMRYQVTKDNEALENVKKSLKGLMLLMDITGDRKNFARNVTYDDGSIKVGGEYRRGTGIHQDKIWRAMGNNDMFKGLIHGFIWSYIIIPESETELRQELLKHMALLPKLEIAQEKFNKVPAYGLRALVSKSEDDKKEFVKNFMLAHMGRQAFNIEGTTHLGGIADWSGINLTMVSTITNIMIAKVIIKDFPSKDRLFQNNENDVLQGSMKSLMLQWKDMVESRRDLLTMAAYQFAVKNGFKIKEANELNDGLAKDELKKIWQKSLTSSIWGLREIPINRSKYNISYDYSLKPDWSLSWWPKLPWKSVKEKQPIEYHMQGAYAYPFFESTGIGSNFIWKDQPFSYKGGSSKLMKDPGADYLYTYWMAKLAGLI